MARGSLRASICAISAALGITRAASRSDDRIRSLESAIEVCVTDLARLDGRFSELHDDTAVVVTRVDWVAESASAAGTKRLVVLRLGCRHSSGKGRRTKAVLLLRLLGSTS